MPRLLRDILCVIETFHKYASEDDEKVTLTHRELKQLLEGEFGDFLQPHVFHAVERKLNLLDIDRDGTISFEEFLLEIFSLLNLCYHDIKSSLTSESEEVSRSEKTDDVGHWTITRGHHQVAGVLPTQGKLTSPLGIASSAPLSNEDEAVEYDKVSPWDDTETHNLPRDVYEPTDLKSQYLEDGQEVVEDVRATEDDGVQFKINKPLEESNETSSPTKKIPGEGDTPVQRQSDTKTNDQKEITQRPSKDQEAATEENTTKHSKAQDPPLQGDGRPSSEPTDLPMQAASRKPSQAQKYVEPVDEQRMSKTQEPGAEVGRAPPETTHSDEPEDGGRTPETHGLPAQEREQETAEKEEGGVHEAQIEHKGKTQALGLGAQLQDGEYQEFQGSWRENDAEKGSGTQDLSSKEGNQSLPEIKDSVPGEEAKHAEEELAEAFESTKNGPAAEETPGARERMQELTPFEKQAQRENSGVTRTHDKLVRKDDASEEGASELPVAQNSEGSCETLNSLAPEEGNSSSETGKPHVPGDSQSQEDPHGRTVQARHTNTPDTQKQRTPGENGTVQEAVLLSIQGDVQLPQEQEQPAREKHDSQSPGTKGGPGRAVEPGEHSQAQESTAGDGNRKFLEAERSGALDGDFPDGISVAQLPDKDGNRKELKVQGPHAQEDGAPETQEILLKSLEENNLVSPKIHLEKEEPTALEREDKNPQEPSEEVAQQSNESSLSQDL